MIRIFGLVFCCTYLNLVSGASFVDSIEKCSIYDTKCETDLFQSIIRKIAKTGIEELGIPPIDPIHFENISVGVPNAFNISLIDGVVKGAKDCVVENFDIQFEKEFASLNLSCDVMTLKGKYSGFSDNELIKTLLGSNSVHGEGFGKVKIEKIHVQLDFDFYVQKRANNLLYIKTKTNKFNKYKYNVEKVTFSADSIFVGNRNIASIIVNFLNENWQILIGPFGDVFLEKIMEVIYFYTDKFFDVVPTTKYIIEDLTPYARSKP